MRGQLYHGYTNATALFSSLVVSKLDNLGFVPGQGKALCPWDVWGKKNVSSALRLG